MLLHSFSTTLAWQSSVRSFSLFFEYSLSVRRLKHHKNPYLCFEIKGVERIVKRMNRERGWGEKKIDIMSKKREI